MAFIAVSFIGEKTAMAWWETGHQTVGMIAQNHIKPKTKEKIEEILGKNVSLDQISVCPDDIKFHPVNCANTFHLEKRAETGNWHFIDIPATETNITVPDLQKYCPNDDCVINQINKEIKTLSDDKTDKFDKQVALMFLVHFIGDIHEPLHCIDDNDKGGNDKTVYLYNAKNHKRLSLHSFWDNILQENLPKENIQPDKLDEILEKELTAKKAETWLTGTPDTKAWLVGTPEDWTIESFKIARDVIYADYKKYDGHYPKGYEAKLRPLAYQQIEKGGLRLAKLLDDIFDK